MPFQNILNLVRKRIASYFYKNYMVAQKKFACEQVTYVKQQLGKLDSDCNIALPLIIKNPQYLSIGSNFSSLNNLRIEAWDKFQEQIFSPRITIGDNVRFNTDVHIGCINRVSIGNNVLLASRIYISDHSHGDVELSALTLPPAKRPLVSKGPVVIQNNVWIGEGVSILPGVTIGENSIIGANAVVTTNIPANSVAAGVPARVIKTLKPVEQG